MIPNFIVWIKKLITKISNSTLKYGRERTRKEERERSKKMQMEIRERERSLCGFQITSVLG